MYMVVLEPIDILEVPWTVNFLVFKVYVVLANIKQLRRMNEETLNLQAIVAPLDLFDDIETTVDNKLIHMPCFFSEARDAIATSLGSAKFVLEQGIIPRADDSEVI